MASKNDESEKSSYPELESYKGEKLPSVGTPVKIREVLIDSMIHYNFDEKDTYKIAEFLTHIETKGFLGLKGRNKKSNNPDTNKHDFFEKAKFAVDKKLHHYHIGIPHYEKSSLGDFTSKYVIHYSFNPSLGYIDIICIDNHPPIQLPYEEDFESEFIENPFK